MTIYVLEIELLVFFSAFHTGVTAQIPPYWTVPGYSLDYTLGIIWELPDYNPVYTVGAPRLYPTCSDYTPPDSGWGIVWAIKVYSGRYHI